MERSSDLCIRCKERLATKVVTYDLYNMPKAYWFAVDAKVCDPCANQIEMDAKAGLKRNYKILQEIQRV